MKAFCVSSIPLRGRSLVDASAGTGKTYAIASLFVRLLLETELAPSQLLVVTFTEAATAELRDRIRSRVQDALSIARASSREEGAAADPLLADIVLRAGDRFRVLRRLEDAIGEFDNIEISTIHGFCQRILMDRSFESDVTFNSQLYGDARPLIDELILDYWANHAGPAAPELLAHMRTDGSRFSVDMARRLAYGVARAPKVGLLPADLPDPEPLDLERFRRQRELTRQLWLAHDVQALIAASRVKKNVYSRRHTPTWVGKVDAYFKADDGYFLALPECFDRFSTRRLGDAGGTELLDHALFLACDALLAEHERLTAALTRQALRFKLELLHYVRRELPERTRRLQQLSFDDLLQRLHAALHAASGDQLADSIRKRYPAALIDEFQDTDPLQLEIFERIYRAPNVSLFLIGDPKQAIYSFRGADVFSYVRAAQHTPVERHYTMTTNYRSDPSLIAAVNHLFSSSAHPFLLSEIHFQAVEPRPGATDVLESPDGAVASGLEILLVREADGSAGPEWAQTELPAIIANEICAVLRRGFRCKGEPVVPGDVAVLTRTNDQAFQVQAALRRAGVASVVLGDKSVYASTEARELERVLRAVVEPSNHRLVRAALATDLIGMSAREIASMDETEGEWEAWLSAFHDWNGMWVHTGFVQMMRALMNHCHVPERWLSLSDGERRMTNLLQLVELLHAAGMQGHLGPSGLFAFLTRELRRDVVGIEAEAAQIRLESDAALVKITTMHKSKGLEYPIVFCPYLWSGMLLHQNDELAPKLHLPDGELVIDVGSDQKAEHIDRARWEQFGENLRLLYVALTRARHRCTIVWGRVGRAHSTSALGYLLHPLRAAGTSSEGAPDVATIQAHLGTLEDDQLLRDIEHHAAAAPITWRSARRVDEPPFAAPETPARALTVRHPSRRIDDRFRTSSFSALTSHSSPARDNAEERIRDHDAVAARAPAMPDAGGPARPEAPRRAILLADFPRGAKAGSFFHDILEHYDFRSPRPAALRAIVEARLGSYQYPVEAWREPVCEQICAVLDTPLGESTARRPLRLGDIPLAQRLSELEFRLPVATRALSEGDAVSARDLARVFLEHPSPALSARYAASVAELGFVPLRGYLRGYIDLVFQQDGSYFLVDYKANHLGETVDAYAPAALEEAMLKGHYYLQYHLYALALHRYLSHRVRDYDYDRHFGGVYYLFIKGMAPGEAPSGIFFEKPPLARLLALSALLGMERQA